AGHHLLLGRGADLVWRSLTLRRTAANAMLHLDDDVFALALNKPFVASAGVLPRSRSQFLPIDFQFRKFFLQRLFPGAKLRSLLLEELPHFSSVLRLTDHILLGHLGLLHELKFAILNLHNLLLAELDFVCQGAILLVLSCLE